MTWSVNATFEGRNARSALEALRPQVLVQNPEAGDQFTAVRDAVFSILASNTVGWSEDSKFYIRMFGNANGPHTIDISVSQI